MEQRLCKDEIQSAAGNLLIQLDEVTEEYRKGRINRDTYRTRLEAIRSTRQRFQQEFRQAHVVMAAPMK